MTTRQPIAVYLDSKGREWTKMSEHDWWSHKGFQVYYSYTRNNWSSVYRDGISNRVKNNFVTEEAAMDAA